ncbi:MAG: C25 family cysteine peptidase, partial [Planctomycetota bacterium]
LACGRIVYDTPTDLTHQLTKTMDYLTDPEVSNWAEHTLLVAHEEQYPLKYTQCKEEIRTYTYAIQTPIFQECYGGAGATNQNVIDYINTYSSGILNYRGHGSQTAWWMWGPTGDFNVSHINQFTNFDRYFVHFDVCCDNMDFPGFAGDCFSESIMKTAAGAIATNGAIIPSYTIPNHDYDKEFYKAIYDLGINNIGYASNFANITVYNVHGSIGQSNIRTYVWLGDACIDVWTNTMQTLAVTHPSVLLIGTSTLEVNVGFEGAMVCAQNSEVYATGYTDATGGIILEFTPPPAQPGDLTVTVSAHNYLPYQQIIPIIPPSGPFVVFESVAVDDDILGNNNGQLDYGETSHLSITAENVGIAPAMGVTLNISTADPLITILDGSEYLGNIAPGASLTADHGFQVELDASVEDGHALLFILEAVGDSTWTSTFSILAHAPDCGYGGHVIEDPPPGNQNGNLDPGESGFIQLAVENGGSSATIDLEVSLSTTDPYVTIPPVIFNIGELLPGQSIPITFEIEASPSCPQEHTATLDLAFSGGGYSGSVSFDIIIGDLWFAPTGPDAYGYYAYDINDGINAPVFDWVEIAPSAGGPGTELTALTMQDDRSTLVTMPFTFQYYGLDYTELTICTNGWLAMGNATPDSDWSNSAIPNVDGPPSMIAPFWEDMNLEVGGQIATYYDTVEDYFIVEFYEVPQWSPTTALETFEVIFYDPAVHTTPTGDGKILIQYMVVGDPSECTVGIENQSETDGLQYLMDATYDIHATPIDAEMAILFMAGDVGPEVTVTLTPYGAPIQIPAAGGSFSYNVEVANNGTSQVVCDFWVDATLPGGGTTPVLLGPVNATLPSGFLSDRDRTQDVPDYAPAGSYTYNGYIGLYPGTVWNSSSFPFEKLITGDGMVVGGWNNYGESFDEWMTAPDEVVIPDAYALGQNYPNPFNPVTAIDYALPEAGRVQLAVYDVNGRLVANLVNGYRNAGLHQVSFDAAGLSSGVYIYRMSAGEFIASGKMVLMK